MIKPDFWITQTAYDHDMIVPFVPRVVREKEGRKVISYGCGSYGYDIRLSPKDFRVFQHLPGQVVDPKRFNPKNLRSVELHEDESGEYFILPGLSYGLGVSLERVNMPRNITAICLGKSTYARVGVIANITPIESSWSGHITLEFSNSSPADVRLYVNEGVCQLLFFEGLDCDISYSDREGKYQDQTEEVTLARV